MLWVIIIILAIGLLLLLVFLAIGGMLLLKTVGSEKKPDLPYVSRGGLLSPAERSFIGVLERAIEDEYRVMAKVRMADLIKTKSGLGPSERQKAFNKIQSKHLDFVLCCPDDFSVAGVVELDDSTHRKRRRRERDAFVDRALRSAGISVTRIPAQRSYSVGEVRERLSESRSEGGSRVSGEDIGDLRERR
jgi:hypothetical protein